mmetsp:Transcript_21794/g.40690  ORF Transcript_21794/g.40690 Transcript_21794/m.40690 type:complete len:452 (+) Transcript_21794:638-1993(+)
MFSSARFILPYLKALAEDPDYVMLLRSEPVRASDLHKTLSRSITNVYNDVINEGFINETKHPSEYALFDNPFRVIDGPCYAFLVHGRGPAVGDFGEKLGSENEICSNITISSNIVDNLTCWNNEIPANVDSDDGIDPVVTMDARGAVLQFVNTFDFGNKYSLAIDRFGRYRGNIVSDAQIMVANAILDGALDEGIPELQLQPNTIPKKVIEWAMQADAKYHPKYRCNGDSMHHCIKGLTVIRVEDTVGFAINSNSINHVNNLSKKGFDACTDYHEAANFENQDEQQMGNIRLISVAAVRGFLPSDFSGKQSAMAELHDGVFLSQIKNNILRNAVSENGNVIVGIDIQGYSKEIEVLGNYVNLKEGVGMDPLDQYIALRIRSQAELQDASIVVTEGKNTFRQECVKESNVTSHGELRSRVNTGHHRALQHSSGEVEWKYGSSPGCPFQNHRH